MDTKKLLIVAAAGLAVYMLTSGQARAATQRTTGSGATAPGAAAAARREAADWNNVGRTINDAVGTIGRLFRNQKQTDTGDEVGRLATRYPAPDDAVPLSIPGDVDQEAAQSAVWGDLLTGGGFGGVSPNWGEFSLGF